MRLGPYLRWFSENELPPAPPSLTERLDQGRLQNALLRLELGEQRGRYIRARHVRRLLGEVEEAVRRVFAGLRESAPGFQGHSEAEIAQRLTLEAEVLQAQAAIIDQALAFWRQPSRRGKKRP